MNNVCFVVAVAVAVVTQVLVPAVRGPLSRLNPDLAAWLTEHDLQHHAHLFVSAGVLKLFLPEIKVQL